MDLTNRRSAQVDLRRTKRLKGEERIALPHLKRYPQQTYFIQLQLSIFLRHLCGHDARADNPAPIDLADGVRFFRECGCLDELSAYPWLCSVHCLYYQSGAVGEFARKCSEAAHRGFDLLADKFWLAHYLGPAESIGISIIVLPMLISI